MLYGWQEQIVPSVFYGVGLLVFKILANYMMLLWSYCCYFMSGISHRKVALSVSRMQHIVLIVARGLVASSLLPGYP
jgi:hypothetical protein